MKKVIGAIIAVVIIVAAVLGILYYTTDLFKTPEQLFYKHYESSISVLEKMDYAEAMKQLKNSAQTPVEVSGEITAKVTINDPTAEEVAETIGKTKIMYNTKTVGQEEKMESDITLNYDNKDILTLNILQNKDRFGLKVNEAYDKYISVENNNLKELFEKLGADTTNVPDKLEMIDIYEFFNIEKDMLDHIEKTYSGIIKENIPAENYTVEKNVSVNIDGTDVTTNAYKLTLTEKQLETIMTKILETLKEDEKTLDLIVTKCNMIITPYKELADIEEMTKEDVIDEIEYMLRDTMTSSGEDTVEFIVYGAKDNRSRIEQKIEDTTIAVDMIKSNNKKMILTMTDGDTVIDMTTVYDDKNADVVLKANSDDVTMEINIKEEIKATGNVSVQDFTSENSVKLNDMTTQEINELIQTIYNNVIKVLPEKLELLGINTTGGLQYNI